MCQVPAHDLPNYRLEMAGGVRMPDEDNIDLVFSGLGFGRWQLPILVFTLTVHALLPVYLIGSTLLSAPMAFRCSFSQPENKTYHNPTRSIDGGSSTTEMMTLAQYNSQCGGHSNSSHHQPSPAPPLHHPRPTHLQSCPLVEYDTSVFPETVISEFDVICERSMLRPLFQMMNSAGAMLGSPVGGLLSDRYGRKRAIQMMTLLNLLSVLFMVLSPWYVGVLVARFLVGASGNCMLMVSFSLAQEMMPPRLRTVSGMLLGTSFSGAMVGLAGVGYFLRPWRLLLLAGAMPLLLLIPLAFKIEESPRWLVQHGRGQEATHILARAARHNHAHKSPLLNSIIEGLADMSEEAKVSSGGGVEEESDQRLVGRLSRILEELLVYLRSPGMRTIILVCPLLQLLLSCVYLGIMLNANNFTSNDPFVYVALTGVMEFCAILLATPFNMCLGRRILLGVCFLAGGSSLLLDLAIPTELLWLRWVLVMTAMLLAAAAFQVNFLYVSELFPTVIRSRGVGLTSSVGNFGFLLAPIVTDILAQKAWWVPSAMFGGAGILAGLLVPLLPETNKKPLPDRLEDVEKRRRDSKKSSDSRENNRRKKQEELNRDGKEETTVTIV